MNKYTRAKRTKNLFDPDSPGLFKVSRSKIELFIDCPRCFYLDRRLGVGRPRGFPFNLNSAVDTLLKKEFDQYREKNEPHPLITQNGIDAIPYQIETLNTWRTNFTGIQYHHVPTNLLIFGAIDDLWINSAKEMIVVDYKATSKKEKIDRLNDTWHITYKRQMEIYQWLIANNGYAVSKTGYFVYCNGITDKEEFNSLLEFEVNVIPYEGDSSWVEKTIMKLHECLKANNIPPNTERCEYCGYRDAASDVILNS